MLRLHPMNDRRDAVAIFLLRSMALVSTVAAVILFWTNDPHGGLLAMLLSIAADAYADRRR